MKFTLADDVICPPQGEWTSLAQASGTTPRHLAVTWKISRESPEPCYLPLSIKQSKNTNDHSRFGTDNKYRRIQFIVNSILNSVLLTPVGVTGSDRSLTTDTYT